MGVHVEGKGDYTRTRYTAKTKDMVLIQVVMYASPCSKNQENKLYWI